MDIATVKLTRYASIPRGSPHCGARLRTNGLDTLGCQFQKSGIHGFDGFSSMVMIEGVVESVEVFICKMQEDYVHVPYPIDRHVTCGDILAR